MESNRTNGTHHNHLINEQSPYLQQHASNPVDWYPWGDEAFNKAKDEDKPVFLSIGYATCHWCHVMAHESFEDAEVARLLNKSFVSVKVDREERPDIDQVYMAACQILTGQGGWPLSIFMTPEGKPFFAGTYFPKNTRMGMPGFTDIVSRLSELWHSDRQRLLKAAREITDALQPRTPTIAEGPGPDKAILEKGYKDLAEIFDSKWGGFGKAPKFPTPHQLTFLLRWHKRNGDSQARIMVEKTLDAMRDGGIYDQIGFGFHRYSVDEKWLVPHFEKMLYDQALLAIAYTEAYQALGNHRYEDTVREILAYVLRDMTAPEGGFYSAEDADSEGVEGKFYVWKPQEIKEILGRELGSLFCRFYGITDQGKFEHGYSIPHISKDLHAFAREEGMEPAELKEVLQSAVRPLYEVREIRVHPLKDDKILTSWNGLMISALAKASQALGESSYGEAAGRAAEFILRNLRKADGTLLRRYRHGHVAHSGCLDDYAFLVWGLLDLYETTFKVRWLEEAMAVYEVMIRLFWDESTGGFFFTGKEHETLVSRNKEIYDGALPSGNSAAFLNTLRLGRITGNIDLEKRTDRMFQVFKRELTAFPKAFTQFLNGLDFMLGPGREIVVAGDADGGDTKSMVEVVQKMFLPNKVLLLYPSGKEGRRLAAVSPFVEAFNQGDSPATAYLCEQYACKTPLTDAEALKAELG